MTDLSDFGAGVERDDQSEDDASDAWGTEHIHYPHGRCRAMTVDGQTRCGSPAQYGSDTCPNHPVDSPSTTTIDDGPRALIEVTVRKTWDRFENDAVRAAVRQVAPKGSDLHG